MSAKSTPPENSQREVQQSNPVVEAKEQPILRPVEPRKPQEQECCGNGCHRCVWTVYEERMEEYQRKLEQYEKQLKKEQYRPN